MRPLRFLAPLVTVFLISCGEPPAVVPTAPSVSTPVARYRVTGKIRDDLGDPVQGANFLGGDLASKSATAARIDVTTDAKGEFVFSIPNGQYDLTFFADGYRRTSPPKLIVAGADVIYEATLGRGVKVRGKIRDAQSGELLNDVMIDVLGGPDAGTRITSAPVPGSSGDNYITPYLMPGTIGLRASKDGYAPVEQSVTTAKDAALDFSMRSLR